MEHDYRSIQYFQIFICNRWDATFLIGGCNAMPMDWAHDIPGNRDMGKALEKVSAEPVRKTWADMGIILVHKTI